VAFLVALVGVGLLIRRPAPLRVLSVTPTRALDDLYRAVEPTDTFSPQDTFFVSVELQGYRPDMTLVARWRYEGEVITETELETTDSGSGYAGFALRSEALPWPAGEYSVEIVYQERVLGSATFRVTE
jgi:hypothetical protein